MRKHSKSPFFMLLILLVVLGIVVFLGSTANVPVLSPKGWVAFKERRLIIISTLLMLIVVIPVFILTFFIAWRYRASNEKAKYLPNWAHNTWAEVVWWGVPFIIILSLSILTWKQTHDLDPLKPLDKSAVANADQKPLVIQVVALQWKWLFLYPEQQIATLNFVQFPKERPIHFNITADAPMNSFWIPALSGQIFAMPQMVTQLHMIAKENGEYAGSSANISGEGFSGMTFIAKVSDTADFDQWVADVKSKGEELSAEKYTQLARPSSYDPVSVYSLKDSGLFDQIVMSYMMPSKEMK